MALRTWGILFGESLDGGGEDLIDVPMWPEQEKLLQEKSALGYFFSGHPFTSYLAEVSGFAKRQLDSLEPSRDPVMLAGIAVSLRTQMTRRGKMLILLLDDATAQVEVVIFNELYEQSRSAEGRRPAGHRRQGQPRRLFGRRAGGGGSDLRPDGRAHAVCPGPAAGVQRAVERPQAGRIAGALQSAGRRMPGVGGLQQPERALPGTAGGGLAGTAG